jgi:hypothetical protein
MKVNFLIIEGFASLITQWLFGRDEDTASHKILPIVFGNFFKKLAAWKEISSTKVRSKSRAYKWILENNRPGEVLFLVGKSMGVVEIDWVMKKLLKKKIELRFKKVCVICIDGHSKLFWEWIVFPFRPVFGSKRSFEAKIWKKTFPTMKIYNFCQRIKYPIGAFVNGSDYERVILQDDMKGARKLDHFTIIHNKWVLDGVHRMCRWVLGK